MKKDEHFTLMLDAVRNCSGTNDLFKRLEPASKKDEVKHHNCGLYIVLPILIVISLLCPMLLFFLLIFMGIILNGRW